MTSAIALTWYGSTSSAGSAGYLVRSRAALRLPGRGATGSAWPMAGLFCAGSTSCAGTWIFLRACCAGDGFNPGAGRIRQAAPDTGSETRDLSIPSWGCPARARARAVP